MRPCARAPPRARAATVTGANGQRRSPRSPLIGGENLRGRGHARPAPGMTSPPRQLGSAPPRVSLRGEGGRRAGARVRMCCSVAAGPDAVAGRRGNGAGTERGGGVVRAEAARSRPFDPRPPATPPRGSRGSEPALGRLRWGPLAGAPRPRPKLTTSVSRSSAGSQLRSRGPPQSRQTSARQR